MPLAVLGHDQVVEQVNPVKFNFLVLFKVLAVKPFLAAVNVLLSGFGLIHDKGILHILVLKLLGLYAVLLEFLVLHDAHFADYLLLQIVYFRKSLNWDVLVVGQLYRYTLLERRDAYEAGSDGLLFLQHVP